MESLNSKKICIAGGSGFIGKALMQSLQHSGYTVDILPRPIYQNNAAALAKRIEGCFAILNLAGASINKRWTVSYKAEILNSRIRSVESISQAITLCKNPPERFISASAVGIYNTTDLHNEQSLAFGVGFLTDVCKSWESAADKMRNKTKLTIVRLGVVLSKDGGTLKQLLPLFRIGLGGRMGKGNQAFPHIHLRDVCNVFIHILHQENPSEIYNLVTPNIITNKQFTQALAKAIHRPAIFAIPSFALKLILGQRAAIILEGQHVIPANLQREGFSFDFPDVNDAGFFS